MDEQMSDKERMGVAAEAGSVEAGGPVKVDAAEAKVSSGVGTPVNVQGPTLAQLYERMNPKPVRDEQREGRRQRRVAVLSALGDGISALSNLYFTSRYAPNMYDGRGSLSERAKARYDRAKADWEARRSQWWQGYERVQALDVKRELERERQARQARQDALAAAKAQREEAEADLRRRKLRGEIDDQEYKRQSREADREYDRRMKDLNMRLKQNQVRTEEVKQSHYQGGRRTYYGSLPDPETGKMVDYYSRADYEAALYDPERGLSATEEQKTTTTKGGVVQDRSETTRNVAVGTGRLAGQAMAKARQGEKKRSAKSGVKL